MAVAVLFNTLEYVRKLERAGVPAQQAEAQAQALADALGEAVATRNDLRATEVKVTDELRGTEARLSEDLRATEARLSEDLRATETKLEMAILAVKHELGARIDKLGGSVDMIKWLFGFVAAANIAIFVRLAMQP